MYCFRNVAQYVKNIHIKNFLIEILDKAAFSAEI